MAMGLEPRRPGAIIGTVVAIIVLAVAGCQHAPRSARGMPPEAWRVLERVGEARTVDENSPASGLLRPGETLADRTQVISGKGALLILQKGGVQITVGEDTSFRLPTAAADSGLDLDRGWLRVRLVTAVNRKMRVKTAHFDINASNTTLALRAAPHGSDLTVEAGSVTLATTDGLHHATLVAGAAAKINQASGDYLLIRTASGLPFTRVAPLPAKSRHHDSDPSKPNEALAQPVAEQPSTKAPPPRKPVAAPTMEEDVVILPASRLKSADMPRSGQPTREPIISLPPKPLPSVSLRNAPPTAIAQPSFTEKIISSSIPAAADIKRPAEPVLRQADASDPLQIDFDRLTEGLVDGL